MIFAVSAMMLAAAGRVFAQQPSDAQAPDPTPGSVEQTIAPNPDAQPNRELERMANGDGRGDRNDRVGYGRDERWRFKHQNGHWWYWLPSNQWVFWNGTTWVGYTPEVYASFHASRYPSPRRSYYRGYYDGGYYPDQRWWDGGYYGGRYWGPGWYGPNYGPWGYYGYGPYGYDRGARRGAAAGAAIGGAIGGEAGAAAGVGIGAAIGADGRRTRDWDDARPGDRDGGRDGRDRRGDR
jgi:hypothetical protein